MKYIKINAIGSTNDYLKELSRKETLPDGTVVITQNQTHGKGQLGAHWYFEMGKSLAFSVFKRFESLPKTHKFAVNFAVSLGIRKGLAQLGIPKLSIKWPNDILSDGMKVCGILVENQLRNQDAYTSIIGIGLNVNNQRFSDLPKASSLLLNTGIHYSLDEVFETVLEGINRGFAFLENENFGALKEIYESHLFRRGVVSSFEDAAGKPFSAIIEGVTYEGLLQLRVENEQLFCAASKEVILRY